MASYKKGSRPESGKARSPYHDCGVRDDCADDRGCWVCPMARKLRLEFAGACYHVTNRGNYRRDIFESEGAAKAFHACLGTACSRFGWLVHAFAIMRNHFHLALETPEPNLSEAMKWLQGTWAQRFNRLRKEIGRPFQGRYRGGHVEPGHVLAQVAHYIHLNPVRAKIVPPERIAEYRWSSLTYFAGRRRPAWLVPTTVLHESGGLADTRAGWRSYAQYLALQYEENPAMREEKFARLVRGWAVGSATFRAELREKLRSSEEQRLRFELVGADRHALDEARVEWWEDRLRTVSRSLSIDLASLPPQKSAREKLALAVAMKDSTSVSLSWLAQRLQMGATDSVASLISRYRASGGRFHAGNSGFRT
jgi:putative transposase